MKRLVIVLFLCWFWLALLPAQQAPQISEGERLLIETTQILGAVSGSTDRFSLVQQYMAQRQLVQDYFEKQYPGQTVAWELLPAQLKAK